MAEAAATVRLVTSIASLINLNVRAVSRLHDFTSRSSSTTARVPNSLNGGYVMSSVAISSHQAVARRQACYDGALGARGIHSLQSYGQVDLTHDTNAYTISSIYHDGTLKMYTSHPIQPTSRGRRPEYVMHQLKGWSMTSDFETFRKGATYYRNGQDWAMEQRDEAIRRANERVDEHHIGALAIGAGIIQASSFVSESTRDEIYIIETLSEESRTLVAEDFNTTTPLQESEVSSDELMVDLKAPFQRSVMHSSGLLQSRRKRRNAGNSDYDLTQRSERLLSKHSRLS